VGQDRYAAAWVSACRLPPGAASWPPSLFPWARLVDRQRPTTKVLAIEAGDRGAGLRIVGHLDEAKTPWTARVPILQQMDTRDLSIPLKQLAYLVDRGGKREIPNKDIHRFSC
jgi:hypothetical protein